MATTPVALLPVGSMGLGRLPHVAPAGFEQGFGLEHQQVSAWSVAHQSQSALYLAQPVRYCRGLGLPELA